MMKTISEDKDRAKLFLDAIVSGTLSAPIREFLRKISNLAFNELDRHFQQILSHDVDPDPSYIEDFCCRLRRCTSLLLTVEFDLNFATERVQVLFKILGECCPSKKSSTSSPALLSILEVFIDELLTHHNMIQHLATICPIYGDHASNTIPCNTGIIMECICSHFLLSSSSADKEYEKTQSQSQQLSLPAAVALLGMLPLTSAPRQLQCHVIRLVNRCLVNAVDHSRSAKDCYFAVLEQATINCIRIFQNSNPNFLLGFDVCVSPSTRDLVNCHVAEATSLPETVISPEEYIERVGSIVAEPWRGEAHSILKSLLEKRQRRTRDDVIGRLDGQDACVAGALLELMGSSLVKIVEILRGGSDGWEREFMCGTMTWREILGRLSNLVLCGVERGICPIWQGGIFAIVAAMNFLAFEEGNLDMPRDEFLPPLTLCKTPRRSSQDIALNWQKLQSVFPKKEAEPQRGSSFLSCLVKDEVPQDWDDLEDFIETKPGKDYGQWLKNRKRFNLWKRKKSLASSRERKLTFWKKLAG